MELALDTFICLDLETTGVEHSIDRIIEIGAVKFREGVQVDSFSKLVNPGTVIPPDINALTGIDNDMVESAPAAEEVIAELERFGEGFPFVVGHNFRFDVSFLKHHLSPPYLELLSNSFIDTGVTARMVWPGLKKYGLQSLLKHIDVKEENAHRALPDAEHTAMLYLYELATIKNLPPHVRNAVAGLLFGERDRRAVLQALESLSENLPQPVPYDYDFGDNVIGTGAVEPAQEFVGIGYDSVRKIFGTRLREILPDYENRLQQVEMAVEIAGAFNRSEILLSEAPTGVGKSLAYLVPAVLWSHANGEGVVVSTQTKNLQDQLFNKDIPLVQEALGIDFKTVLLKGRANYLCLLKFHELVNEAALSYGIQERQALMPLVVWAETTKTGDIAECTGFNRSRYKHIWSRISCEGSFCLGRTCSFYRKCFLIRAREETMTAHLRVVNHHLFFADLASGGDIVGSSHHAVLDEAHNLEKVAASYMGPTIDQGDFVSLFNQIQVTRPVDGGFLMRVRFEAAKLSSAETRELDAKIRGTRQALMTSRAAVGELFSQIAVSAFRELEGRNETRELRYLELKRLVPEELLGTCDNGLKDFESRLLRLVDEIETLDSLEEKAYLAARGRALAQDLADLRREFEFLVYPDTDRYVFWIDVSKRTEPKLVSAPLEVGKLLDENLYDRFKTIVLSSATLSIAGEFSFIKSRMGLNLSSAGRTTELALDSPFDLEKNVSFLEAGFIPSPLSENHLDQVADTILQMFSEIDVKGMVLFTSYRSITAVVTAVGEALIKAGYELFVQDSDLSPFQLLTRYRQSPKAIIFGTDSFWEGVDLPGAELELLVIAKLPFSVPERPWIKANLEKIEAQGGNPFQEYSLPEAVIRFRQGFGRLIRKKTDRGCVVVLDSRLSAKQYGTYFVRSVRPKLKRCLNMRELINTVKLTLSP